MSEYPNLDAWIEATRRSESAVMMLFFVVLVMVIALIVVREKRPQWFPTVRLYIGLLFIALSVFSMVVK